MQPRKENTVHDHGFGADGMDTMKVFGEVCLKFWMTSMIKRRSSFSLMRRNLLESSSMKLHLSGSEYPDAGSQTMSRYVYCFGVAKCEFTTSCVQQLQLDCSFQCCG